jgi:hypothetical protein
VSDVRVSVLERPFAGVLVAALLACTPGSRGEVRNPNHPARRIEAMERARLALAAVLERACPEP